jgi:hypothetical protein
MVWNITQIQKNALLNVDYLKYSVHTQFQLDKYVYLAINHVEYAHLNLRIA